MHTRDQSNPPASFPEGEKRSAHHPLFGALKGLAFVPVGVDLTKPADPDWGAVYRKRAVVPAKRSASRDP